MAGELSYSPNWAKHVVGTYPPREPNGDGGYEIQLVKIRCGKCGDTYQVPCASGAVRQHVLRFSLMHVHKDPLIGFPK